MGVDLFFVLSGFLISGLLFSEYKRRRSIGFKRFFIRRGFKIYPAFYCFLLGTFLFELGIHKLSSAERYLSELVYVQNYAGAIWAHTWSLAVEEHFYILLPLLMLILIRSSSNRDDPFRAIPAIFVAVGTACLAFRIVTVLRIPSVSLRGWDVFKAVSTPTHERIDSLFFGVLLGYLHHFRPQFLEGLLVSRRNCLVLANISGLLLLPALLFPPSNRFMLTAGLTMLYLGFGIVLMLCLHVRGIVPVRWSKPAAAVGAWAAFVGMYSYSIYLWHGAVMAWVPDVSHRIFHARIHGLPLVAIDLVLSLGVGITLSRVIEYPMLGLRDRLFPAVQSVDLKGPLDSSIVAPVAEPAP